MRIIPFEFLIPRRPVSLQTKKRENLQAWKNFVRVEAEKVWQDRSVIKNGNLQLTLVSLCDDFPADTDNIIKPIQDALVGLVFQDDSLVSDVESHRRFMSDRIDMNKSTFLITACCGHR